jgi:hypothetical protein
MAGQPVQQQGSRPVVPHAPATTTTRVGSRGPGSLAQLDQARFPPLRHYLLTVRDATKAIKGNLRHTVCTARDRGAAAPRRLVKEAAI